MGLANGPLSDPYAAYCLDEACMLWGHYVEDEVEKARARGNNDKHKESLVRLALHQIFDSEVSPNNTEEEERPPGMPPPKKAPSRFRDPASVIRVGD